MRRLLTSLPLACLLAAGPDSAPACPPAAGADGLGLYFSQTEFTIDTATATAVPGFLLASFIVLTDASGGIVTGYEVGITGTAPDFTIPLTSLFLDSNLGTNTNQRVTFAVPKPVAPGGTVLSTAFLGTASLSPETISFGPSSPSTLRCDTPVVFYAGADPVACSYPHGTPVVAWLNGGPVAAARATWGGVKSLFR